MAERELPQNIEAEQSVIGAMMLSEDAILVATESLRDEDFSREAHRIFFRIILKLADEDGAVDLVTVTERLRKDGWLEKIGGITFVAYIANYVPTAANISYHAKIVKEMALLRKLIQTGTEMICSSYDRRDDVEDILDKAQAQIFFIASAQNTKTFSSMKELLLNTFQRVEKLHENKGGALRDCPRAFVTSTG